MWIKLLSAITLLSAFGLSQIPAGNTCPPASKDIQERVEAYLSQRLVSGTGTRPSIKSIELLPQSCYRKLTITLPSTTGDAVMYLSPDERFLTSAFYDLSIDPKQEVTRIADNVTKLLVRDESPRFVGSASGITVVEFGDLQCPYCKLFGEWYRTLPDTLRSQITLVFKHVPLQQHSWARSAALYSACLGRQSSEAFWHLADFLLEHQNQITPETIQAKVKTETSKMPAIDFERLSTCASTPEGASIVDRDINVAQQLGVHSTPTLFINGRRALTPRSKEDLQALLEHELQIAAPAMAGQTGNGATMKGDIR